MNLKKRIAVITLAVVLALSALSLGYAAWHTEITAGGNVSASGKWDLRITDASVSLSTGASASWEAVTYALERANEKDDSLVASVISATTWLNPDQEELLGTQSNEALSSYTYYYAVDGSKYDLSDLKSLTEEQAAAIRSDESTVTISDHLKAWYRYIYPTSEYYNNGRNVMCTIKVVDGLLRDTTALLKEMYPDTYQNYVLCADMKGGYSARWNYTIARMVSKTETIIPEDSLVMLSEDATSASFADVIFSIPGAWANYTMTVTNNGTADAKLSDAIIELATENPEQLVLDKPDLTNEIIKPGESCTFNLVVKVPEDLEGELNAAGVLTIRLPYSQTIVPEEAPSAGHTHG